MNFGREKMTGKEKFELDGKSLGFDFKDFWEFQYSNIYNMQETIAEFLVAKALGVDEASNSDYWSLCDVMYKGKRIEVKASSYYHAFKEYLNTPISPIRVFGITKAYSKYKDKNSTFERQNDIYVFCLNIGETAEESDPLNLKNWEFYIIPTAYINEVCGDAKTISIQKIKKLGFEGKDYFSIRGIIDQIIDKI
jgi:hypothetical protein